MRSNSASELESMQQPLSAPLGAAGFAEHLGRRIRSWIVAIAEDVEVDVPSGTALTSPLAGEVGAKRRVGACRKL